jgi:type IV pilus assembly protein PilC
MAAFTYDAINAQGLELRGEIHAADVASAQEQLRMRGLLAQNLVEHRAKGEGGARTAFKKVKPKSLQVFSRQLATMIEAGVSVVAALVTLEEQTDDKYLREVIGEIRSDVEAGMVLSKAFARHPKVFNRLYVSMIEAGESSGTLDEVLDRAATQIEKETKIKRRIKGAMVYPAVVITFAFLVLTFMLLFIIPVFVSVFDQLNGDLPKPTQIVMAMSNALRHWWFVIFPAIGATAFALRRLKQTERGRQVWDRFKLRIPMKIGDVVKKVALARMSRTLSTLVAAGVDIIKALEITGATAGNWVVEQSIERVRERVHEGASIGDPLVDDPVFPPMVGQMVKIGEETGELEKMLGKVADFYEDEVDTSIQSLTSIIEPVLMIFVGFMVGAIVIAMYMPMFKMLTLIK